MNCIKMDRLGTEHQKQKRNARKKKRANERMTIGPKMHKQLSLVITFLSRIAAKRPIQNVHKTGELQVQA